VNLRAFARAVNRRLFSLNERYLSKRLVFIESCRISATML